MLSLTDLGFSHQGAMPLLAHKPIQDKFVLAAHIEVGDEGGALGTLHRHHLRPIPVLVLDHEGVELAFRDCPVQEQGVGSHICHCQLTQAWWCQGLPRLFRIPVWSGGWGRGTRAKAKQKDSTIALSLSPSLPLPTGSLQPGQLKLFLEDSVSPPLSPL